jgi:hypothetical protein
MVDAQLGQPPRRLRLQDEIGALGQRAVAVAPRLGGEVEGHALLAAVVPPVEQPTASGRTGIPHGRPRERGRLHDLRHRRPGLRQHLAGEPAGIV